MLELLVLELKILFFCASKDELLSLGRREFYFGIILVLLAGIGRFWQDGGANILLRSGISSVIYVYLLAIPLWIQFALIRAENWKLGRLVSFVCLTAPPAFLLAIPLAQFFTAYQAESISVVLILLVAVWRLALLAFYVAKTASLSALRIFLALFLPLSLLITSVVWFDALYLPFGYIGRMRRELRVAMPSFVAAKPMQARSGNYISPHVTSGSTGWLTQKGIEIAERPPLIPIHMFAQVGTQSQKPVYSETFNTPDGPVDIYVIWTLGRQAGPAPAGFEYLNLYDPLYQYRHPLIRLLAPLLPFCFYGFIPVFILYFVLMFIKPKRS